MKPETFRLSSRQISLLHDFAVNRRHVHIDECLLIDQRTFGSLIRNGLIDYNARHESFVITPKGRMVYKAYLHTETGRAYKDGFAPSVQILINKIGVKANVIEMKKAANQ